MRVREWEKEKERASKGDSRFIACIISGFDL